MTGEGLLNPYLCRTVGAAPTSSSRRQFFNYGCKSFSPRSHIEPPYPLSHTSLTNFFEGPLPFPSPRPC